jgi:hypothetical protein
MSFSIAVETAGDHARAQLAAGGAARLDCHLEYDGDAFPADPWRDRAVVILGWWTENHVAMCESHSPVRNSFMEGPYEFTVTPVDGTLALSLIRRSRDADEAVGEVSVAEDEYRAELVEAAESVLQAANPGDPDVETLRVNLEALRRI